MFPNALSDAELFIISAFVVQRIMRAALFGYVLRVVQLISIAYLGSTAGSSSGQVHSL